MCILILNPWRFDLNLISVSGWMILCLSFLVFIAGLITWMACLLRTGGGWSPFTKVKVDCHGPPLSWYTGMGLLLWLLQAEPVGGKAWGENVRASHVSTLVSVHHGF